MANFTININGQDIDENATIGEDVTKGDLLYLSTDSKYYKASSSSKTTSTTELKMALEDGLTDEVISLLAYGYFEYDIPVLTSGSKYYMHSNAGAITTSINISNNNVVRYIGTAHSDSVLLFNPDQTYISDNGYRVSDVAIKSPVLSHTHTESEITDLDKYTRDEVDALIANAIDSHFEFIQSTASNTWVILHELGKVPSVHIQDTLGNDVEGDITIDSIDQLTINFNTAFSGTAYLN